MPGQPQVGARCPGSGHVAMWRHATTDELVPAAEEAMRNAKSDIDLAAATGEFATMAAQLAAIQKPLHSGG